MGLFPLLLSKDEAALQGVFLVGFMKRLLAAKITKERTPAYLAMLLLMVTTRAIAVFTARVIDVLMPSPVL